ncbi:glutathione S-transferase family protein [Boseongicola aestuarii]|uniref:Glutathione S-transferase GST-6.0 n=1 Tax=Boseongicola aestuarii TaxID=1470561 RepID=A0A238J3Y3_9RHOB|nr:glutathione S-transferase family protein [Boseongicola aestuarii]SMX25366.1 Glutathione S-transferase GST-6.0 [Boseongicola aestuarii]
MPNTTEPIFTLFWEYLAGSIVVQATLEEIGVRYQLKYVDMGAGEHLSEAYRRRNPAGRVPALQGPDGETIGETGAIITLLSELYSEAGFAPAPGDKDRAAFLFWLNVLTTSGYMTAGRVGHPERYAQDESAVAQVAEKALADYDAVFDVIETAISGDPFFMERGLTPLDYYITMLSEWHLDKTALFSARTKLARLCQAVNQNRSYRVTMDIHALQAE